MDALRLFFGLALPDDLRRDLGRWQRGQSGIAGWSRSEGLHLTLAFLGVRTSDAATGLAGAGVAVAARHPPLRLRTTALGGFPEGDRARVLWLGLGHDPALEALAEDLRAVLADRGEAFDAKAFRPHITLARFKRPHPVASFPVVPSGTFLVQELVLFESRPQGWYVPFRSWKLGGHPAGV